MLPVWVVAAVGIFVMIGGVAAVWLFSGGPENLAKSVTSSRVKSSPSPAASGAATPIPVASALPVETPPPRAVPVDSAPRALPVDAPTPGFSVTTAPPVAVDFNPNANDAQEVRGEVLKRIDLMPDLKPEDKDKLYAQVDRARAMGLIIQIPFGSGESALSAASTEKLKKATSVESVRKLVDDPTVVFVVLGYADTKGNETANFKVSKSRADSAIKVLEEKCGFNNVMHAVGMGGSDFFDTKQAEKNRLVEVWAVLP